MALIDKETPTQTLTPPAATEPAEPIAEPEPVPEPEQENSTGMVLGLILIAALLGGGAIFYLKVLKPKKGLSGNADISELDGFDFGDDEDDEYTEMPSAGDDDEDAGAYAEISFEADEQTETEDGK